MSVIALMRVLLPALLLAAVKSVASSCCLLCVLLRCEPLCRAYLCLREAARVARVASEATRTAWLLPKM